MTEQLSRYVAIRNKAVLFADGLEAATDPNVAKALNAPMCCDELHCGCRRTTVGEYLAIQLREAIRL